MKTKTILPITEARKNIFAIADDVQKNYPSFTLTQNGRPKAVILSYDRYDTLLRKKNSLILADGRSNGHSGYVFPKTLIIRDESRVVYLSNNDQNEKEFEENLIKAQLYIELIENYGYPLRLVEYGRYVKVGPKEGKHYIEADIIVNDDRGNARMIFEVSPFSEYEKNADHIIADLFHIADSVSWIKKPEHLVYYSRKANNGESKTKIMVIDYPKFKTFASWKKSGRPAGKEIPRFK